MKLVRKLGQLGVISILIFVCPQALPGPDVLPRSWDLDEIGKTVPPFTAGRVYVLAWIITEDIRGFRIERCLALNVLDETEGSCLATLYRHPNSENAKWELSTMHVSGDKGTKYWPGLWILHAKWFKNRPKNKEVYESLGFEGVGWRFEVEKDTHVIGCGVCQRNWREAIGEKPTRDFTQEWSLTDFLLRWRSR